MRGSVAALSAVQTNVALAITPKSKGFEQSHEDDVARGGTDRGQSARGGGPGKTGEECLEQGFTELERGFLEEVAGV